MVLRRTMPSPMTLQEWMPTWQEFVDTLFDSCTEDIPVVDGTVTAQGLADRALFNGVKVTGWFNETTSWVIPCTVCVLYLIMVPTLQRYMESRDKILATNWVTAWNVFLSGFSWVGVYYTVPALLEMLQTEGWEASVCAPGYSYGHGMPGMFVMFFIVSKLFETVDTFFLIIRKSQVIFLHWYHHATVMMYCWHAYAVRSGHAGLWFAGMNYTVHAVMYLYFACMMYGKTTRNLVKPFAMYITIMQISQMVIGMVVLVKSATTQLEGRACSMNKSNVLLGLIMYASYFVLFAKLFLGHYVFGGKQAKEKAQAEAKQAAANADSKKIK